MSLINVDFPNQPNYGQQSGATPPRKPDTYSLDLFDLIKRKFGIITFFVLMGLAASMLYFFKAPRTYESRARIFVDEKKASVMSSNDGDSFTTDASIEKYLVTIKSSKILKPAIAKGKFHELETFEETNDILASLVQSKALLAKPADTKANSGVIKLSFRGPNPEECREVLNEVVGSFDDYIKSTTKHIGGETAQLVTQVRDDVFKQLNDVDAEIKKLMAQPGILIIDGRVSDPHQMQLTLMHQDLHEIQRERIKLQARVKNVRADQASGKDLSSLIADIIRETADVKSGGAYASTQTQLVQLKIQEQDLLNQFGADHPDVRQIRQTISVVENMKVQEAASMNGAMGQVGGADIVTDYVNQLNQRIALIFSEEEILDKSIKAEQSQSTSISAVVENLNGLERKRERLETVFNTINERLNEIDVFKEHLWRNLSVLDPASVGEQVAPSLMMSLAAGLFLGTLMGMFFAVFKDMAEKTFRSSDDVSTMLNTRVVGHVSMFQKARQKKNSQYPDVQPEIVTIHAPASQASESYRAIRTSIFFKAQELGAKVIQVTSPAPGDGKSTTISNLAASIAQSGRRVLLIDADMRKPVIHKLFGANNDYGLSSVICGEMDPMEAVQVIQPEYFSVVSSGPIPSNPAELLTSARFAAVIDAYRNEFDYVLIDSPPMMAVTDPSIVCSHVDLIYMVMRIRNGVRTNATRAKELIDSMGVEMGGVVINGLRRRDQKTYAYSGQYGYGTYSYGNSPTKRTSSPLPGATQRSGSTRSQSRQETRV